MFRPIIFRRCVFSLFWIIGLLFSQSALAATYYVDAGSGNNGNSGTSPGSPWATIAYAISQATAGDIIEVAAGTYAEGPLSVNKGITLRGPNTGIAGNGSRLGEAILQRASASSTGSILMVNAHNVTIDGFTLSGATTTAGIGIASWTTDNSSGTYAAYNNTIIKNNRFLTLRDNGVSLSGVTSPSASTTGSSIENNYVSNIVNLGPDYNKSGSNRSRQGFAFAVWRSYYTSIIGNEVVNSYNGISYQQMGGSAGTAGTAVISGNTFTLNGDASTNNCSGAPANTAIGVVIDNVNANADLQFNNNNISLASGTPGPTLRLGGFSVFTVAAAGKLTFSNNNITNCLNGYMFWGMYSTVATTAGGNAYSGVTINGGTVTDCYYGVGIYRQFMFGCFLGAIPTVTQISSGQRLNITGMTITGAKKNSVYVEMGAGSSMPIRINVVGNTITNHQCLATADGGASDDAVIGIYNFGTASGTDTVHIKENQIVNNTSGNRIIQLTGAGSTAFTVNIARNNFTGNGRTTANCQAISNQALVHARHVQNVIFTNNNVEMVASASGVLFNADPANGPNTFTVTDNRLITNGRVYDVQSTANAITANFARNWWGTGIVPNTGGGKLASVNGTTMDVTPWLLSDEDIDPVTPGFQPWYGRLAVGGQQSQSGGTGRITEAATFVNGSQTVDTVYLYPGTGYTSETVTLNSTQWLIGAGSGAYTFNGTRVTVQRPSNGLTLSGGAVTLNGGSLFSVTGNWQATSSLISGAGNNTITVPSSSTISSSAISISGGAVLNLNGNTSTGPVSATGSTTLNINGNLTAAPTTITSSTVAVTGDMTLSTTAASTWTTGNLTVGGAFLSTSTGAISALTSSVVNVANTFTTASATTITGSSLTTGGAFSGAAVTSSGASTITTGGNFSGAALSFTATTLDISGAISGTTMLYSGSTATIDGGLTATGLLTIAGGSTVSVGGNSSSVGITSNSGTNLLSVPSGNTVTSGAIIVSTAAGAVLNINGNTNATTVSVTAATTLNVTGNLTATSTITLTRQSTPTVVASNLSVTGNLTTNAASAFTWDGATVTIGGLYSSTGAGALTCLNSTVINVAGTFTTNSAFTATASSLTTGGAYTATGSTVATAAITTSGASTLTIGGTASCGNLSVTGGAALLVNGTLTATGAVILNSGSNITANGNIAGASIAIASGTNTLSAGFGNSLTFTTGNCFVTAGSSVTNVTGNLVLQSTVSITASTVNLAGDYSGSGALTLSAAGNLLATGAVSGTTIATSSATNNLTGSSIAFSGALTLTTGTTVLNLNGNYSGASASITAGTVNETGTFTLSGTLTLNSAGSLNSSGAVSVNRLTGTVAGAGNVTSTAGITAVEVVSSVNGVVLTVNGNLTTTGSTSSLTGPSTLNVNGNFNANGAIVVNVSTLLVSGNFTLALPSSATVAWAASSGTTVVTVSGNFTTTANSPMTWGQTAAITVVGNFENNATVGMASSAALTVFGTLSPKATITLGAAGNVVTANGPLDLTTAGFTISNVAARININNTITSSSASHLSMGTAASTLAFGGSVSATLPAAFPATVNTVIIDKQGSATLTLDANTDLTVSNVLTLTNGRIIVPTGRRLNHTTAAAGTGTAIRTNGYIVLQGTGAFVKRVTSGTNNWLFPVGVDNVGDPAVTGYRPVMIYGNGSTANVDVAVRLSAMGTGTTDVSNINTATNNRSGLRWELYTPTAAATISGFWAALGTTENDFNTPGAVTFDNLSVYEWTTSWQARGQLSRIVDNTTGEAVSLIQSQASSTFTINNAGVGLALGMPGGDLATPVDRTIIIAEVFGGGGTAASPRPSRDYVTLYNATNSCVDITGYTINYWAATGTGAPATTHTIGTATIQPKGFYLVSLFAGASGAAITPDEVGSTTVNIASAGGKLAIAPPGTSLSLTATTGAISMPTGATDFVGWGSANQRLGGTATPAHTSDANVMRRRDLNNGTSFPSALMSTLVNSSEFHSVAWITPAFAATGASTTLGATTSVTAGATVTITSVTSGAFLNMSTVTAVKVGSETYPVNSASVSGTASSLTFKIPCGATAYTAQPITLVRNGCADLALSSGGVARALTVAALSTPSFSSATALCSGHNSSMTIAGNTTGAILQFMRDGEVIQSTTSQNLTAAGGANLPGTYTVRQIINSCTTAASNSVVVGEQPAAPAISAGAATLCENHGTDLTATGISPGATVIFLRNGTAVQSSTSTTLASADADVAGTYTVRQVLGTCTSAVSSNSIVVNTAPATPTMVAGASLCVGHNNTFTATGTTFGATVEFLRDGIVVQSGVNATAFTASSGANVAGTYTVQQVVNGCASPVSGTSRVVSALPTAPALNQTGNVDVCPTATLSVTNTAGCGGCTYLWSNGATATTITPVSGVTYTVAVTNPSGCHTNSPSVTPTILPNGTWVGTSDDWTAGANWCGGAPTSSTNVSIPATASVDPQITGTANVRNLTIGAGRTVTVAGGGSLNLYGNHLGTGQLTSAASGTISLLGSTAQTLASLAAGNLTINSAGVTLTAPATVAGTLTFTNGDLVTSDVNTLTITATGSTGAESATSRIVGPVYAAPRNVGTGSLSLFGMSIGAGTDDLGMVTVARVNESGETNGSAGIGHIWTITADNQPTTGRDLTFSWNSDVDNGNSLTTMQVWSRETPSDEWLGVGAPQSATGRTLTVNTTHFSEWTVSDEIDPLPVTLLSFTGKRLGEAVKLFWSTVSERNNSGFRVERSTDNTNWTVLAFVEGNGTSSQRHNYQFADAFNGNAYYRLRQIDHDGKSELSPVIFVGAQALANVKLLPNPAKGQVFVTGIDEQPAQLELINMDGRVVNQSTVTQGQAIDLRDLPAGVYQFRITANEQVTVGRLVLQ